MSVGLFRTEFQFMLASRLPRMSEQEVFYRTALECANGKQITFRAPLDIGSDKVLPYMTKVEEENPALGWRAIRIGLDRPGLLRSQLRGLLRAGSGREMRIMFPMIATLEEFEKAKSFVEDELVHLRQHDRAPPSDLKLGVMIEVPSLLWQLDEICARVDFLSVGSNDLLQYLYATDRDNKRVDTAIRSSIGAWARPLLKLSAGEARRGRDAVDPLRRTRRQAARSHGLACLGLPRLVDGGRGSIRTCPKPWCSRPILARRKILS